MSVCVILLQAENVGRLIRWGALFARAREESLHLIIAESGQSHRRVIEPAEELPKSDHPLLEEVHASLRDVYGIEISAELFREPDLCSSLLAQCSSQSIDLLVLSKPTQEKGDPAVESVARYLFQHAPCRTLLLRLGEQGSDEPSRVLIPASGGPHAEVGLQLARGLVEQCDFELTPLYVERVTGDVAEDVGKKRLHQTLNQAGIKDHPRIKPRVVVSEDLQSGIVELADLGFDLILIGQSPRGSIRKWLFGTLPGRLVTKSNAPVIGVIRQARPIRERLVERASNLVSALVPQLAREERVDLFERLEIQSQPSFDYFALILLSTAIASLGLIQNSAAVVIGAMLVAPLMTPILGMGLGLVQGNGFLLRVSSKSVILGFLSALGAAWLVGLIARPPLLTDELLARGNPGILDFWVALFSGLAAAYCSGRKGLSAALPGVAIAAALVPPIATIGISFSMGEWANGQFAAILFGTNVVIIILGASLCFFFTSIRAHHGRSYAVLFTLFVALSAAIAYYLRSL